MPRRKFFPYNLVLLLFLILPVGGLCQVVATSAVPPLGVTSVVTSALAHAGFSTRLTSLPSLRADGFQSKSVGVSTATSAVSLTIQKTGPIEVSVASPAGTRTASYLAYSGTVKAPNVADVTLDARTATLSRLIFFPVLELAEINEDSAANLTVSAPEAIDGHMVYILTVTNHWPVFEPPTVSSALQIQYYIDKDTFEIIRRDDSLEDPKDHRVKYARTVRYESFQPAGALAVPYKVTETVAGQLVAVTQWSNISVTF